VLKSRKEIHAVAALALHVANHNVYIYMYVIVVAVAVATMGVVDVVTCRAKWVIQSFVLSWLHNIIAKNFYVRK
jgi:hypothetical protein